MKLGILLSLVIALLVVACGASLPPAEQAAQSLLETRERICTEAASMPPSDPVLAVQDACDATRPVAEIVALYEAIK
jgi:hypothetical protein